MTDEDRIARLLAGLEDLPFEERERLSPRSLKMTARPCGTPSWKPARPQYPKTTRSWEARPDGRATLVWHGSLWEQTDRRRRGVAVWRVPGRWAEGAPADRPEACRGCQHGPDARSGGARDGRLMAEVKPLTATGDRLPFTDVAARYRAHVEVLGRKRSTLTALDSTLRVWSACRRAVHEVGRAGDARHRLRGRDLSALVVQDALGADLRQTCKSLADDSSHPECVTSAITSTTVAIMSMSPSAMPAVPKPRPVSRPWERSIARRAWMPSGIETIQMPTIEHMKAVTAGLLICGSALGGAGAWSEGVSKRLPKTRRREPRASRANMGRVDRHGPQRHRTSVNDPDAIASICR